MTETAIAIRAEDRARLDGLTYPAPADMTETDVARATDDLAFVQSVRRGLETAKTETLGPIRRRLEELRSGYDVLLARVSEAEVRVKTAILEWRRYREAAATRAAREAAAAQAALAAAEARVDARAAGVPPAQADALAADVARAVEARVAEEIAPAPIPRATVGEAGTATVTLTWTFEVVNATLVPRDYLAVDLVGIGKAVRVGVRAIPGVRIFQRESLVGRRR